MATPLVVVQNNHVQRLTAPVAEAARANGIALHDVSSGEHAASNPLPDGDWAPILVIGSVLFVHQWARDDARLTPWVFWDDEQYDAVTWAEMMGRRYLNCDGYETTIGRLQRDLRHARHIRPRSGIKMVGDKVRTEDQTGQTSIPGLVVTPETVGTLGIDPATRVWASVPQDILAEVRIWMIGGRAAAGSTYRIAGGHARHADHAYVDECMQAAWHDHRRWHPGRHYVVDYALTGEGWRIVEYNPIHSSGHYAADPAKVLMAFMAAEEKRIQQGGRA